MIYVIAFHRYPEKRGHIHNMVVSYSENLCYHIFQLIVRMGELRHSYLKGHSLILNLLNHLDILALRRPILELVPNKLKYYR